MLRTAPTVLAIALLLATVVAPDLAAAQPGAGPATPAEPPPSLAATGTPSAAPPTASTDATDARRLDQRTHVSIVPTGNLLPAGDAQLSMHEFLYMRAAFGITDRVELSVGLPTIGMVANAGVRLALTDRESPLKLVVGGGLWRPLWEDAVTVGQGTITVAYQTGAANLHATVSGLRSLEDDGDDGWILAYSAGLLYRFHAKGAFAIETARIALVDDACYADDSCGAEATNGMLLGVKLLGTRTDIDLGVFIPQVDSRYDDGFPALPVVSLSRIY